MKRLMVVMLLIALFLGACANTQVTPTPTPNKDGPHKWKTSHQTSLFSKPDINSQVIQVMYKDLEVLPAKDAKKYECKDGPSEYGSTENFCYVKALNTGKEGWVVRAFLISAEP